MDLPIVQNDTPQIVLSIRDRSIKGWPAVDLSAVGTVAKLRIKRRGATGSATEITCAKINGIVLDDGSIALGSPYDVAGFGGRCVADCPADTFATVGFYEAEVAVTFNGGTKKSTVFDKLGINVRAPL